jgi:hypothetical protein
MNTTTATLTATHWCPASEAVITVSFTDDIVAGAACGVRLAHPDKPGSLISLVFYPVRRDGGYGIQVATEYTICTDPLHPLGTETWSDCEFGDLPGIPVQAAVDAAEREARWCAEQVLANGIRSDWDGEPR